MAKKEVAVTVTQVMDYDGHAYFDFTVPPKVGRYVRKYLKRHGKEVTCCVMDDGSVQVKVGKYSIGLRPAQPPDLF